MTRYPTPGVMLDALRARFGHAELKEMISAEVIAHDAKIMRMQAVANLWERAVAEAEAELARLVEPYDRAHRQFWSPGFAAEVAALESIIESKGA